MGPDPIGVKQRERTFRHKDQRTFNIDAKVPHSIFNLGVTNQNRHGTQIPGCLADARCFRSA
jgi:hypothetical protein